jgi:hypothetical protein
MLLNIFLSKYPSIASSFLISVHVSEPHVNMGLISKLKNTNRKCLREHSKLYMHADEVLKR